MKGKQALKRVFVLLLTGVTAVTMLAACSQPAETPDPVSQTTVQTAESAASPESQPATAAAEETAAVATPAPTPAPEELVLKGSSEVTAGKGIQLCPLTADGVDVDTASLTWQSSDESVAIVTNGWVDALRPGSVTITASGEGYTTVTQEVTVRQVSCSYCGQAGHTAGACPQKAADEQAAAQAAAEAQAQAQAQAAAESAAQQQAAEEAAAPQEGICPVCGSQLNPDGSCNVIHEYAGYAMAYYDEEAGQVYIICNGCGQRFWRSEFADPRDFALNHGYPCCSRFDAGAGILP